MTDHDNHEHHDVDGDDELEPGEARLDALLTLAARGLNAPPPAPREEMWTAVRATLDASRGASSGTVVPIERARGRRLTRHAAWGAIAAGALIAGVAIGRTTTRDHDTTTPATLATASAPTSAVVATTPGTGTRAPDETRDTAVSPATTATTRVPRAPSTTLASSAAATRDRSTSRTESGAPAAYRDAAAVHLAAAEALIVSLRAPSSATGGDTAVAAWAGDLLGTTRMLLDSPATRDRRTKKLLEDLELVLAQIARLKPDSAAGDRGVSDRQMIDQAIRQRRMLTRLRAAGA